MSPSQLSGGTPDPVARPDTLTRAAAAAAIDAEGTTEAAWDAYKLPCRLPQQDLPNDGPVLVVSAHPDDEVLGFGGTMAALLAAGITVHTLCLTDGEASHGDTTPQRKTRLAARRRDELARALGVLGAAAPTVHLALPDTGVDEHEDTAVTAVTSALATTGAVLCVAPWDGDLHSDHEAAGRAAGRAAHAAGIALWSYPVWMWHWARPHDSRVPWHRAVVLPTTPTALQRKLAALECFESQLRPRSPQTGPVLPPQEMAHHTRLFETVML